MNRRLQLLCLTTIVVAAPAFAERARVNEECVRVAIEESWTERSIAGQSLEIEFAPPLLGEAGGDVRVEWPDPPIATGPRALTVAYEVNGRVVSRALANVLVRQEATVWILIRDVQRGDRVTAADLHESARVWERSPRRAITGPLPPGGFVARSNLTSGAWLRHSDVRPRPDVEAGEEIFLVARTGAAAVSVTTSVRRGGSVGDTILVLNPITGSVVRAVLVSPSHAELAHAAARNERSAS